MLMRLFVLLRDVHATDFGFWWEEFLLTQLSSAHLSGNSAIRVLLLFIPCPLTAVKHTNTFTQQTYKLDTLEWTGIAQSV